MCCKHTYLNSFEEIKLLIPKWSSRNIKSSCQHQHVCWVNLIVLYLCEIPTAQIPPTKWHLLQMYSFFFFFYTRSSEGLIFQLRGSLHLLNDIQLSWWHQRANYMFIRCSQTTTCNTHLIPTSGSTLLSAPSTYRQQGADHRRGETRPPTWKGRGRWREKGERWKRAKEVTVRAQRRYISIL